MREISVFRGMEALLQDCRYSCRSLRKSPGFVAVVVLSLGLGIAANSTIFSVLNAAVYRPLPYEQSDRLMVIWQMVRGKPESEHGPAIAEVVDWSQQTQAFGEIAQTSGRETGPLSRLGAPELISVQYVTPNFFHVLRVKPEAGRIFAAAEAQDQVQTVVISDFFARRHFKGVADALGNTFDLGGVESTVVGVMPPQFTSFHGQRIDVWQPINPASARYSARKDAGWLMPVGRLKPGVSVTQAQQEMQVIARRMEQAYPAVDKGMEDRVVPLQAVISGWARMLYPLFGAVGFVLLIACLNVANLLQSRAETRRKEKTVRASLGANRRRLIQQLLAESGLLAFCGGALGLVLTYAGIKIFLSLAGWFPNSDSIRVDLRVVLFTAVISVASALLFGMAPAWQWSNPDLNSVLREGDRRTVAGSRRRIRQSFVVAEVALAMVLLVGAGLMIKTVLRMTQANPGYDPDNVITAFVALAEGGKYVELIPGGDMQRTTPAVNSFYERLLADTTALPGVESVATVSANFRDSSFSILGRPAPAPEHRPEAAYGEVSAAFFRTLRIPLKSGRYIDESDGADTPWVVVINETLAKRYFPSENPLGQRLLMRYESYHIDETRPRVIVGVVGDAKLDGLAERVFPTAYSSFRQQTGIFPGGATMAHIQQQVFLRMHPGLSKNSSQTGSELRRVSAKIDPDQPVTDIMSMHEYLAGSMADTQFITHLLEIFAAIALLLAAIGIYGVISYFVSERTHEIGVRIALGAERSNVLGLITIFGLRLAVTGLMLGSLLALALTRLITRFLFDVSATDPVTFVAVAGVLLTIALLAGYVPAHRATRVDPMVALRHE
ncbi:MAG: ABC transporter permease [Acidobacteriaceae bacterium]|nr:ABC transporter permease [Acidobacteriaceae bacterium]